MKINVIKYYYNKCKVLNKNIIKNRNNNFILNYSNIVRLYFYEYIQNKLQIFSFKGILLNKYVRNNNIIIIKYDNYNIIFLYFYLNSKNLINIFKLGKFNLNKISL
ncbi:hypothetical protein PBANKA_API00140 [Plasmodium berghei ANKA]|uniref:Uncharacterized protein n=2 Tax=Plasmodium berghei TaxID=5821 RepID=A0A509ARQ2_PLABA|nr:open reading frame 101 [Plasmodium berghei]VUC58740.1 hypothetical protein PBANKA_API00140 [Plasmodium berghei ANKA]